MAEFLSQNAGREPLELVGNVGRGQCGVSFDEQVHVVRHDLHGSDYGVPFGSLLAQQRKQALCYGALKNGQAVLRTPSKVVLEGEDGALIFPVALVHHADKDRQSLSVYQPVNIDAISVGIAPLETASYSPVA